MHLHLTFAGLVCILSLQGAAGALSFHDPLEGTETRESKVAAKDHFQLEVVKSVPGGVMNINHPLDSSIPKNSIYVEEETDKHDVRPFRTYQQHYST